MNVDNKIILQVLNNYSEHATIVKVEVTSKMNIEVSVINASGELRKDVWKEACGVITPDDWDSPNIVDKAVWKSKHSFLVKS